MRWDRGAPRSWCLLPGLTEVIIKVSNPTKDFLTWFPNPGALTKALVPAVGVLAQVGVQTASCWSSAAAPLGSTRVFKHGPLAPQIAPSQCPSKRVTGPDHFCQMGLLYGHLLANRFSQSFTQSEALPAHCFLPLLHRPLIGPVVSGFPCLLQLPSLLIFPRDFPQ